MAIDTKWLAERMYPGYAETTNVDKILARGDAERLRILMRKEFLERKEVLELLVLLAGAEVKLLNLDYYDRYLCGKLYIWIRDFGRMIEKLFDVIEDEESKLEKLKEEGADEEKIKLQKEIINLFKRSMLNLQHSFKFLVDVYLYLLRTTLSIDARAFDRFTTSRVEHIQILPERPQPQGGGLFGIFRR